MRKSSLLIRSLIIAFCATVVFASVLFVFALLTPEFGEEKSDPILFFDEKKMTKIQAVIEVENNDYSVSLGERFTVRYRVQYVSDAVNPAFESAFEFVDFAPFEVDGEAKIYQRKVGFADSAAVKGDIFEYTYEVTLFLVNGLIEDVYTIPSVKVDYIIRGQFSDIGRSIIIENGHTMNVTRNVTDPISAEFKEIKNSFDSNEGNIKNLFVYAGYLLRAAILVFIIWWIASYVRSHKQKTKETSIEKELLDKLNQFENSNWVCSAPAVQRLEELRALTMGMALYTKGIVPLEFYESFVTNELALLFNMIDSPDSEYISYADVFIALSMVKQELGIKGIKALKNKKITRFMGKFKFKKGGK